jgi:hypothetical protein
LSVEIDQINRCLLKMTFAPCLILLRLRTTLTLHLIN